MVLYQKLFLDLFAIYFIALNQGNEGFHNFRCWFKDYFPLSIKNTLLIIYYNSTVNLIYIV